MRLWKPLSIILLVGLIGWLFKSDYPVSAQSPPPYTQLQEPFLPQIDKNIAINYTGVRGTNQFCYWFVARWGIGNASPTGPLCVTNIDLTGSIAIAWNVPSSSFAPNGYTLAYDVVRLVNTNVFPSNGTCTACLLSSAVTVTSATDTLGTLGSSYTIATYQPGVFTSQLDNTSTTYVRYLSAKGTGTNQQQNPIIFDTSIGSAGGYSFGPRDGPGSLLIAPNLSTSQGLSLVTKGVGANAFTSFMPSSSVTGTSPAWRFYTAYDPSNSLYYSWYINPTPTIMNLVLFKPNASIAIPATMNIGSNVTDTVPDLQNINLQFGGVTKFAFNKSGAFTPTSIGTAVNCANGASPAVCTSANAGSVAIPTGVNPTLVVQTSAVTANSEIFLTVDDTVTIAATTCNSTLATLVGGMAITNRVAGVSFTISFNGTVTTNPVCLNFQLIN